MTLHVCLTYWGPNSHLAMSAHLFPLLIALLVHCTGKIFFFFLPIRGIFRYIVKINVFLHIHKENDIIYFIVNQLWHDANIMGFRLSFKVKFRGALPLYSSFFFLLEIIHSFLLAIFAIIFINYVDYYIQHIFNENDISIACTTLWISLAS